MYPPLIKAFMDNFFKLPVKKNVSCIIKYSLKNVNSSRIFIFVPIPFNAKTASKT